MDRVHFSAKRPDWATPPELVPPDCDLDVCATAENAKCLRHFTPEMDGLAQPWTCRHAWCNPPYGRDIADWLAKGSWEIEAGNCKRVTYLLPARTDTKWFHTYSRLPYASVEFLKGRVKFVGAPAPAPFPSLILRFHAPE